MNLEDPLLRPVSTPLSTYVAVARGTVAPGDQPRESRGSHRDRSPPKRDRLRSASFSRDATGKEQPRAGTPAPVSSRDAWLSTTAVHLRLGDGGAAVEDERVAELALAPLLMAQVLLATHLKATVQRSSHTSQ